MEALDLMGDEGDGVAGGMGAIGRGGRVGVASLGTWAGSKRGCACWW
jgi:hypothetical protein